MKNLILTVYGLLYHRKTKIYEVTSCLSYVVLRYVTVSYMGIIRISGHQSNDIIEACYNLQRSKMLYLLATVK